MRLYAYGYCHTVSSLMWLCWLEARAAFMVSTTDTTSAGCKFSKIPRTLGFAAIQLDGIGVCYGTFLYRGEGSKTRGKHHVNHHLYSNENGFTRVWYLGIDFFPVVAIFPFAAYTGHSTSDRSGLRIHQLGSEAINHHVLGVNDSMFLCTSLKTWV